MIPASASVDLAASRSSAVWACAHLTSLERADELRGSDNPYDVAMQHLERAALAFTGGDPAPNRTDRSDGDKTTQPQHVERTNRSICPQPGYDQEHTASSPSRSSAGAATVGVGDSGRLQPKSRFLQPTLRRRALPAQQKTRLSGAFVEWSVPGSNR